LKLLGFIDRRFVGKLTKLMEGYNKQGHWSNVDVYSAVYRAVINGY